MRHVVKCQMVSGRGKKAVSYRWPKVTHQVFPGVSSILSRIWSFHTGLFVAWKWLPSLTSVSFLSLSPLAGIHPPTFLPVESPTHLSTSSPSARALWSTLPRKDSPKAFYLSKVTWYILLGTELTMPPILLLPVDWEQRCKTRSLRCQSSPQMCFVILNFFKNKINVLKIITYIKHTAKYRR